LILVRDEWFLGFSVVTCVIFLLYGENLFARLPEPSWLALVFIWLFTAVLGSALSAVRHAEQLATRLGEPYGTLILTLSVTFVEVTSIAAIMLHGDNNPTLARDTMFAVAMIILNGMIGLSLLVGGWRHGEQRYNLQGANAYLGVIIPLAVLSLVLPNFTKTTPGPIFSHAQDIFLVAVGLGLYSTFLAVQTRRHHSFFRLDADATHEQIAGNGEPGHPAPRSRPRPVLAHSTLLIAYILPVVFLAEQFAHPVDYLIETLRVPAPLGGVIIAAVVATPEAISAVRAAVANHMQRAVNIFLGSVLSTIGLTVPAIVLVSRMVGREIVLGLEHTDLVMLLLTLSVCIVTFSSGRTNVMQGAVHFVLFLVYLALIFQG
ncbi:MAG TPA: calcium:proton antiporter, partial [Stellaceae bacterium]